MAKAVWTVESTIEIISHALYILFPLPTQEYLNFNISSTFRFPRAAFVWTSARFYSWIEATNRQNFCVEVEFSNSTNGFVIWIETSLDWETHSMYQDCL